MKKIKLNHITNMKKEEKNNLDPQTVFTINHSDLKGRTQCTMNKHIWRKLSDTEVICEICGTALIVGKGKVKQFLK